ncbi:hypothetical protein HPB47_014396 [Ixodes persulcatus]|uniref:Uncharacterized protein n=1 Tax=Ixodes persulcatus TaxID=34615 RepID=A0AC60QYJ4_IXOPE|nr:hypothetical protein HPB47_014396 [Ixodes persulcatus]
MLTEENKINIQSAFAALLTALSLVSWESKKRNIAPQYTEKEQLLQDVADLVCEFGYKVKPVLRKATATEEGATTTFTATLEPPERATATSARPATNRAARDAATTARVVAAATEYRPVNHNAVAGQSTTRQKRYREHLGSLEKRAEEDRRIKKLEIALEERHLAMEERQIERRLAIEERQLGPPVHASSRPKYALAPLSPTAPRLLPPACLGDLRTRTGGDSDSACDGVLDAQLAYRRVTGEAHAVAAERAAAAAPARQQCAVSRHCSSCLRSTAL